MADTPTSNTSTLCFEGDLRGHTAVAQAENDFDQLQRSLNNTQKIDDKASFREPDSIDLEKGRSDDRQGAFDLRDYLTSSNDANSAAGIKPKHVGVTWEDLEVSGIGGDENKVGCCVECPIRFPSHGSRSSDLCVYICRSAASPLFTVSF